MDTQKRLKQNTFSRNAFSYQSRSFLGGFFDNLFSSDVGNTPEKAKNIGTLKRGSSYKKSGDVGGSDLDYFKFRVDQTTSFSARLRSKSNNDQPIAITILDQRGDAVSVNGNFLFKNIEPGQTDTISVGGLPRGEYLVRLQSINGRDEDYDLELSRTRLSSGGSGGSSGNGQTIGQLQPGRRYDYSGWVGGRDIDLYRFNLDRTSRFTASLANDSNDPIAVSILDQNNDVVQTANGRFLFGNAESRDSVTLFAPTLPSGSYTVRVQSAVGNREAYRLALSRSSLFF